ncbi:hypothetical protein [Nitrogeniibacter aestuarii]|uniref:hypothetical protein n=1 Tax=Nitrogeniibacter aestuarii TaxID=2815343 RepID=UPI001D125A9A|nr:hypothetical protein [Nitrogeniibacter aestuarii]
MSSIDQDGMLVDPRVQWQRFAHIEHGTLDAVHGIVVHQTDAPSAQATFNPTTAAATGPIS